MLVLSPQDQQYVQTFVDSGYDLSTVEFTKISPIAFRALGDLLVSSDCTAQQQRCYIELGRKDFLTVVRVVIRCFTLLDEEYRFQLIVESFGKDFVGTCSSLSNFNLSKERLLEAALRYPRQAARCIQYLGILDKVLLIKIGKSCAEKAPLEVLRNRCNFHISGLTELMLQTVESDVENLHQVARYITLSDKDGWSVFIAAFIKDVKSFNSMDCYVNISPNKLEGFAGLPAHIQDELWKITIILERYLPKEHVLYKKILDLRSSDARLATLQLIIKFDSQLSFERIRNLIDIPQQLFEVKIDKNARRDVFFVPMYLMASKELLYIGHQRLLPELIKDTGNSASKKVKNLVMIIALIKIGAVSVIQNAQNFRDLETGLLSECTKRFSLDCIDDFLSYLHSFRVSLAPLIVYSTLISQPESEAKEESLQDFKLFLTESLNGTLRTNRLTHLKGTFSDFLIKEWDGGLVEEHGEYTLEDSGSFHDILLSGTETPNCLSIYKSHSKVVGLLGPLLNGQNRVCVLKVNGKLDLSADFKLLIKNGEPALLLEPFYSSSGKYSSELIIKFAERRAEALGLKLYRHPNKGFISPGGRAHFEYSDSFGGHIKGSDYSF